MSSSLYWVPPPLERKANNIESLKFLMKQKYGDDGVNGTIFDKSDIPYFQGIVDGGGEMAEDAQSIIDGIHKYGKIELELRF